jgi:transglutaminase-like putative cysteine protease
MNYRIVHRTQYLYSEPVSLCYNEARLKPRPAAFQTCLSNRLDIEPAPADLRERQDFFGNPTCYFSVQQQHRTFTVTATSEVRVEPEVDALDSAAELPWERAREQIRDRPEPEYQDSRQYLLDSPLVAALPELAAYADPSFPRRRPLLEAVADLMRRIHEDFTYDPSFTTVATPISEVMEHRRGVCQDFAHLAIGCLRAQGLPARYASGYIETLPPPGGERLVGADATHAWCAVFAPSIGWVDFDPTNNQRPAGRHITLAWGRDYADVTPLKGVIFGGGPHQLSVSVEVRNLNE